MKQLTFAMQFKGIVTPQNEDGTVLKASTKGQSCQIRSTVGPGGLCGSIESAPGEEAFFESDVVFEDPSTFEEKGTIRFGNGNQLRFETVGSGYLGPSMEPGLRHGCISWRVVSGEGQFAEASGLITSNFTVSEAGEVIDNQFGVLYLP
jgi:hypothetical protein